MGEAFILIIIYWATTVDFRIFVMMQKGIVILIIFLLGIGITQPGGILQSFDVHERYAHCTTEDHDITPLDFVFEHLLNLESIVNLIEGEHHYNGDDHPHDPFQLAQTVLETTIGLPHRLSFEMNYPLFVQGIQYPKQDQDIHLSQFYSSILRPPIAA